jgi:biotin carboxylase
MRRRWAAAGLRQPRFELAATCEKAKQIIDRLGCPCVVKPTRAWSSKGVSIVTSEPDIDLAVADAFAVHGGPIIIEDFVSGRLLSAEGFVSDRAVDVVLTADVRLQDSDRHRVNMALCFPGNFEPRIMEEATALMQRAARALGLERTPFHCECMVGPHGVELIEMAARGGGGHIFTILYELTTGVAGIVHQARLLLGEPLDAFPSEAIRGSCYRFLSAPEGILDRIEGLAEAAKMPGVVDLGVTITPGRRGGIVANGNDRHGYVCTVGADRAEAVTLAEAAAGRIRFVMRPR